MTIADQLVCSTQSDRQRGTPHDLYRTPANTFARASSARRRQPITAGSAVDSSKPTAFAGTSPVPTGGCDGRSGAEDVLCTRRGGRGFELSNCSSPIRLISRSANCD